MRFRKLRIAFSAVCGIICLLVVGLWVRSHWRFDGIYRLYKNGKSLTLASNDGTILIRTGKEAHLFLYAHKGWKLWSHGAVPEALNVQWMPAPDKPWVVIPHWFPVLLFSTLAAAPWIQRFRFSLRTLLIAVTLTAVILGTIVIGASK
jgi:hypothetical protein